MTSASTYSIRPLVLEDQNWTHEFMIEHWGAEEMMAHGTTYYPAVMPGFAAEQGSRVVGMATYTIADQSLEIVSIDSDFPSCGIGSALLRAIEGVADQNHCRSVWLATTNDNLSALKFFQKRDYRLVAVHYGAVTAARKLKPSIPLTGCEGIPLRDEIVLEKKMRPQPRE